MIPPPIDTKKSQPYTKSIVVRNRYKKYRFTIIIQMQIFNDRYFLYLLEEKI